MLDGAVVDYCNENRTALDLALQYQHETVVNYLTSLGAKPSLGDSTAEAGKIENELINSNESTERNMSATDEENNEAAATDRWLNKHSWSKKDRCEADHYKAEANRKVELGKLDEALEYYLKALNFCYPNKDSRELRGTLYSNCSFVLLELKKVEEAVEYAKKVSLDYKL